MCQHVLLRKVTILLIISMVCIASVISSKQKCISDCVTIYPTGPYPCLIGCQPMSSQVPGVYDECVHRLLYLGRGRFLIHHEIGTTEDVYERQCVPCDQPEGATEPQFMQWYEIKEYECGTKCKAIFITTKTPGPPDEPENPVAVPYPCEVVLE